LAQAFWLKGGGRYAVAARVAAVSASPHFGSAAATPRRLVAMAVPAEPKVAAAPPFVPVAAAPTANGAEAWLLQQRVALLEEEVRQRDAEARELRGVVAMKDEVIRNLGARAAAGAVRATSSCQDRELHDILSAKDEIIRGLGQELCTAVATGAEELAHVTQLAEQRGGELHSAHEELRRCVHAESRSASFAEETSQCLFQAVAERDAALERCRGVVEPFVGGTAPEAVARASAAVAEERRALHDGTRTHGRAAAPFTVLPVGEDTVYRPAAGSEVDWHLATFLNGRRSKILFTRLDNEDHYLYGRLPVRCCMEAEVEGGLVVVPLPPQGSEPLALADFVWRHEEEEHAYIDRLLLASCSDAGPPLHRYVDSADCDSYGCLVSCGGASWGA